MKSSSQPKQAPAEKTPMSMDSQFGEVPSSGPLGPVGPQGKTSAVRSVSRAILLLNLEGLVVSANGVAIKALGVAESNFLGQPITNLFEKPSEQRLKQHFDRALKGSAV